MINKVDATPPASELNSTGTRYPKRKRAPAKYYDSDSDGYDSSHSEDDYVPINKVNFLRLPN